MENNQESRLGSLYRQLYEALCGKHPRLLPWHFQWLDTLYLARTLKARLPQLAGRVLDVGCGDKPYRALFSQATDYVGIGGGRLFIAIYNDQGWVSRYWTAVKRLYNSGLVWKLLMTLLHLPYLFGARYVVRLLTGRLRIERGMSIWYDMLDWLGGYPFEVSTPEQMLLFYRDKGFVLTNLKTCKGRHGCNEFVFIKP